MPTWNVFLYAIAPPHDEARQRDAINDILGAATGPEVAIAIQLNTQTTCDRWTVTAAGVAKTSRAPVDTSDPAELAAFLGTAPAPATRTALIVWAHGSGLDQVVLSPGARVGWPRLRPRDWPPGFRLHRAEPLRLGGDPRDPTRFLSNPGLARGVKDGAGRVDLLALNACWMGMLEVAREVRDVCDALVASQVFAWPWRYGELVATLAAHHQFTGEQLASAIVESVRARILHVDQPDAAAAIRSGQALDDLTTAFEAFAAAQVPRVTAQWPAIYAALCAARPVRDANQRDLRSLVTLLGAATGTQAQATAVGQAFDRAVFANAVNTNHNAALGGLSLFCPLDPRVDVARAYAGTVVDGSAWKQFLKAAQPLLPT